MFALVTPLAIITLALTISGLILNIVLFAKDIKSRLIYVALSLMVLPVVAFIVFFVFASIVR